MPVYRLIDQPVFPPPEIAEPGGLLAVGGELSPPRLLLAYTMGIFPWYNEGDPILWWSPDPRCILEPAELQISRSLARTLRRQIYQVTLDRDFSAVVAACAAPRRTGEGTWLTAEMQAAYGRLHELGYAHSVEAWLNGELAGGLYGICLGRCFFGESMFHQRPDASKAAFVALVRHLQQRRFELIDCQLPTAHLLSLGAREIPREAFLLRLRQAGVHPSTRPLPGAFL